MCVTYHTVYTSYYAFTHTWRCCQTRCINVHLKYIAIQCPCQGWATCGTPFWVENEIFQFYTHKIFLSKKSIIEHYYFLSVFFIELAKDCLLALFLLISFHPFSKICLQCFPFWHLTYKGNSNKYLETLVLELLVLLVLILADK